MIYTDDDTAVVIDTPQASIIATVAQAVVLAVTSATALIAHEEEGTTALVINEQSVVADVAEPAVMVLAAGDQGPPGRDGADGNGLYTTDDFVLTAQHLADRGVPLSRTPENPAKVEFVPFGGPEQRANVDFVVTGNSLSWAGLALELLLSPGDAITVRYVAA